VDRPLGLSGKSLSEKSFPRFAQPSGIHRFQQAAKYSPQRQNQRGCGDGALISFTLELTSVRTQRSKSEIVGGQDPMLILLVSINYD